MATSQPESITVDDDKMCSICRENIKTPRYLPCKHYFCHECLSSDIISQTKICKACGQYVPKALQIPEFKGNYAAIHICEHCGQRFSLSCHHSLCKICLPIFRGVGFKCPTCHKDTFLPGNSENPEEWASLFPTNIPPKNC